MPYAGSRALLQHIETSDILTPEDKQGVIGILLQTETASDSLKRQLQRSCTGLKSPGAWEACGEINDVRISRQQVARSAGGTRIHKVRGVGEVHAPPEVWNALMPARVYVVVGILRPCPCNDGMELGEFVGTSGLHSKYGPKHSHFYM